ncbi:recombination-associated protein RdgC [Salinispirillum sp. LH 10-3-1]|uniref:Recombination-associated protein RdgC n=1 Tax=Salinispirillum sp. LH 10-3-1 TaxID=2952525 RepID=A0AB38YCZ9_9GAMM
MWFKNAFVYQVRDTEFLQRLRQGANLEQHAFHHCLPTQPVSLGLIPPHGEMTELQLATQDFLVWQLRREERLLPSAVVNEALADKISELQRKEDRRVGRNEKMDLKDEVTLELLPRAFTRSQRHMVIADLKSGWLYVQCGSEARADDITAFLRDAFDELPVLPLGSLCQPEPVIAEWLISGELPEGITVMDELALRHGTEDGTIKVRQLPWDSEEVQNLLSVGYRPSEVLLNWNEQITVLLNDKCVFKRLKYADDMLEQAAQEGGDSALAEWEAGLHIMTAALRSLADQTLLWFRQDPA